MIGTVTLCYIMPTPPILMEAGLAVTKEISISLGMGESEQSVFSWLNNHINHTFYLKPLRSKPLYAYK
ncbi:hypothetical protein BOV88_13600 [Solemya velum gill symbiont]|uniref:Uncharacterized protein n=1 Tax=Solemya velum gill symbiont TaxID=2340 RepID=A0A1T2CFZ2_SOVGS|nr:hypothetical protein BOV88_13600 [Solemya velum gill symbiont]OOY36403.1 hypothetical protein BOV89_12750 [Solemya velum gill symbiont]